MNDRSLETSIRKIGEDLFRRAESTRPSTFSIEYWLQYAMSVLTQNDELKMRLFRLVEVLPVLRTNEAVAQHLREYLRSSSDRAPALPLVLELALAFRRDDSLYAALVVWAARLAHAQMAHQFIVGSTPEEAIAAILALRQQGLAFTLDLLGETVIADRVARDHQKRYLQLIRELSEEAASWPCIPRLDLAPWGPLPRVNLSLKLSAIVSRFDPINPGHTIEVLSNRLRPILRAGRDAGSFINVDMEHYAVKDLTLDIYQRILMEDEFRDWPHCGIALQCYLPEVDRDMETLMTWARHRGTPITIRLVKGAYWDSEIAKAILYGWPIPLYTKKWESDAAFERVALKLLQNSDIIRPAFATHNARSIAAVIALEQALKLPPNTAEFQMLSGMGNPLKRALVAINRRLRVYAPCGDQMAGMAYFIRRLIENTANESFLRQTFCADTPVAQLLEKPKAHGHLSTPTLPQPFIQDLLESEENVNTKPLQPFVNEPDIDFSRATNQQAMETALRTVRSQFARRYPAIIDHQPVNPEKWFESRNPSCLNEIVGYTADCDTALADRAVAAARRATEKWAGIPAEERADILERAADLLHQRRFEVGAWIVFEVGKTWSDAQSDVMEAIDYLRFYAREARRIYARHRRRDYPGESNEYSYLPRGVVVAIGPYCFPMALITGLTTAALVTGNTVIMKPSRASSVCGAKVAEILIEAGLPTGVLNFVPGTGMELGDHLAQHPDVDMVAYTGSNKIGCRIIEYARQMRPGQTSIKHVLVEMGGKNAIIIDDDADLDEAVQATIASAFGYSGQKCTACSRVIVLEAVYDVYLAKLIEAASGIKPALADLPGTVVGPMINVDAVTSARQWVEIGKKEAKCVLEGGDATDNQSRTEGAFFSPVIFADVPPGARIAQEEIFAPILSVIRAKDFAEAIAIANNTAYALTGGVFSRCPSHIEEAKRRIKVGNLYINRKTTVSRVDRQPFGGFKMSGLGTKAGGPDYLQQFTIPQCVSENTMRHGFAPPAGTSQE